MQIPLSNSGRIINLKLLIKLFEGDKMDRTRDNGTQEERKMRMDTPETGLTLLIFSDRNIRRAL